MFCVRDATDRRQTRCRRRATTPRIRHVPAATTAAVQPSPGQWRVRCWSSTASPWSVCFRRLVGRGALSDVGFAAMVPRLIWIVLSAARSRCLLIVLAAAAAAPVGTQLGRVGWCLANGRVHFVRRTESQRRIRHAQDIAAPRNFHVDVRRHARLQLQLVVRHVDDRGVGDDVLLHDRIQPNL
jgi:hypothetical protein